MDIFRLKTLAPLWVFFALVLRVAIGGERSETLLRLVGDDVGLCVELSQLKSEVPAILRSPLAERVKSLQLYRDWLESNDYKKLSQSRDAIEKSAGKPFGELTYELVGKAVVVAVYPSTENSLQAVLLTETAGDKSIDWLLETWNRKQKYTTDTLNHRGQNYFKRARTQPKHRALETLYYLRLGPIFAVSDKEAMIQRVIDLQLASTVTPADPKNAVAAAPGNLFQSELFQRSQQDLSPACIARVYFNPRACASSRELFDANDDNPIRRLLADYWKRCEAVGLGLRYEDGLIVEANVEHATNGGNTLPAATEPPEVLQRIPADAAIAVFGRTNLRATLQLLAGLVPESDRADWPAVRQVARGLLLGRDPIDDVLPSLGPHWAACLVPRKATDDGDFPADALIALEVSTDNDRQAADGKLSLRQALENALSTGMNYLAAARNQKSDAKAVVKTDDDSKSIIRWIENFGQFEPAYALLPNAITVTSAHNLAIQFVAPAASPSGPNGAAGSLFQTVKAKYLHNDNQSMLVDFAALRKMFRDHRPFFLNHPGKSEGAGDAEKRLDRVDDVLRMFDVGFVGVHRDEHRTRLVAGSLLIDGTNKP